MRVYVLNLPRCVERRENARLECEKWGINPVWIAGDDRQEMRGSPKDYNPDMARACGRPAMGPGEIGCLRGHLRAYQALVNSEDQWAVVMEDDAVLHKDPREALGGFSGRLVLGFDTMPHNSADRQIVAQDGDVLQLSVVPYGAICYAIHRDYASRCLGYLGYSLHMPMDVFHVVYSRQQPAPVYWQVLGVSTERDPDTSVIGDEARMHDRPPHTWRALETHDDCPLLLHQIWIGPNPPTQLMETWQSRNPKRIYKVWDQQACYTICKDYGVANAFEAYCYPGKYPGAADVARYCILHRHGGLYVDSDSICLREMDLRNEFLIYESEKYRPDLLSNCTIQVKAGSPLMLDLIRSIACMDHPGDPIWTFVGPGLLTRVASGHIITKLPSGMFLPHHFLGDNEPCGKPYATHHWESSSTSVPGVIGLQDEPGPIKQ